MDILQSFSLYSAAGDWIVYYKETIAFFEYLPYIWSPTGGNGFGQNISFILGFRTIFETLAKTTQLLNLDWSIAEEIIFFIPFWTLSLSGSFLFASSLFQNRWQKLLTAIIYTTNTYALMLVGGGQMGVALAYAFTPFFVYFAVKQQNSQTASMHNIISTTVSFAFLIALDPRMAGVALIFITPFIIIKFLKTKKIKTILAPAASIICAVLLNSIWIVPFLFLGTIPLGAEYTGRSAVEFFSFANFENSLSLLHPNWPENMFGKVHFQRPEFIILPIISYASLLFIKTESKARQLFILFLNLAALIGAFLSKGTNGPFGTIYTFMFEHVPGFVIYRDPTKWYMITSLAYSILIPYSFLKTSKQFQTKLKNKTIQKRAAKASVIIPILLIIFWAYPAISGQLSGTFKPQPLPKEYLQLKNVLTSDDAFSRTLWIPQKQRYGYFSDNHPAVSGYDFYNTGLQDEVLKMLSRADQNQILDRLSIKYVVLPQDTRTEIFKLDRETYDESLYVQAATSLSKIKFLKKIDSLGEIIIFENENSCSHIYYLNDRGECISIPTKRLHSTEYELDVSSLPEGKDIVFAESYDRGWKLKDEGETISHPTIYLERINKYSVPENRRKTLILSYEPQTYVVYGVLVSTITLILLIGSLVFKKVKK